MSSAKAREILLRLFADFSPRADSDLWSGATTVRIEREQLPVPGLVLLLLTEVVGLRNLGIDEKVAWQVPFHYRGHRATITYEKFGMRLYLALVDGSEDSPDAVATEILKRVRSGLAIVEQEVLTPYSEVAIAAGRITIGNQFHQLQAAYEHFAGRARASFRAADEPPPPLQVGDLMAGFSERMRNGQEGSWDAIAAINAYFSKLEHELVLVAAFADFDPGDGALGKFIGDRWGLKLRRLFDLSDPEANRANCRLYQIAETYRNPYSHGGFDKKDSAVWFHLDGFGAVPARLSDIRSSPHFEMFALQSASFEEVERGLGEVDAWLRGGTYAPAFEWIEAGLDVAYDAGSREQYRRAMDDAEYRRELIDRTSADVDRHTNMDWGA